MAKKIIEYDNDEEPTRIVHEHYHENGRGNGGGYLIAIIIILAIVFLFIIYGLPYLSNINIGGGSGGTGGSPQINIEPKTNINQPTDTP